LKLRTLARWWRSFSFPLRCPPLHERANPLLRVVRLHQFVEIHLLGAGEAFVEVCGVPAVKRFLGDGERCGTELRELFYALFDFCFHYIIANRFAREAHRSGLETRDLPTCQDEVGGVLLSDDRGQRCCRDRRKAAQLDLRKSPGGIVGGDDDATWGF